MKKRIFEYLAGTCLALVFFALWDLFSHDKISYTIQTVLVSLVYGGFILFSHWLMGKNKGLKILGIILIAISILMGACWLYFVANFKLVF